MAIAFGDFGRLHRGRAPDLRVLRDPFSAKPHVLFYATKRVGGDVSDFAAIKLLKFATCNGVRVGRWLAGAGSGRAPPHAPSSCSPPSGRRWRRAPQPRRGREFSE